MGKKKRKEKGGPKAFDPRREYEIVKEKGGKNRGRKKRRKKKEERRKKRKEKREKRKEKREKRKEKREKRKEKREKKKEKRKEGREKGRGEKTIERIEYKDNNEPQTFDLPQNR